ncbi:hypothetical protein C8J57DRAFT_1474368 [Mycena rebaudengoi]|nr:hypothetical protein C8J57DRAFT_1474368 [Mycena rebaudengoi]
MILGLNGKSAYLLFFYSQGCVYALTILGNFAVGIPAQHTPTATPTLSTGIGTVVFLVDHTSVGDQAVITCDRSKKCTDGRRTSQITIAAEFERNPAQQACRPFDIGCTA